MQRLLFASLMIAALILVACGAAEPTAVPQVVKETVEVVVTQELVKEVEALALPAVDPASVTGDIVTAGSPTVYPLSERMAERFVDEAHTGNITIDSIGSGGGFGRFCTTGETDIANASRRIKDEELANCRAIGREPLQFRVGTDGLAVVVGKDNTFFTEATIEELAQIFTAHLHHGQGYAGKAAGRFVPQLLPDLRRRGNQLCRLLPGQHRGTGRLEADLA
jgi:phosphate transport system substrate-binding protein